MSGVLEELVRVFDRMAESHRQLAAHLERRLEEERAARAALEGRVRELDEGHQALSQSSLALGRLVASLQGEVEGLRAEGSRLRELDGRRVDLLTTLAHELRTPLTSVNGALGMLLADDCRAEARTDLLNIALLNTQRLMRLVATLLDFVRLEAGEFGLERKPVDLGDVVAQAVEGLAGVARDRQVEVKVARPASLPPLPGDAERLRSVITNLLENGLKFSPPGGVVEVEIADRGADVLVAVADEGPGIAPQDLDNIFDRFYRGDRQLPGTGLGLYICRAILEEHGGRIWAESRPRGSRFCFVVPRTCGPPAPPTL